MRELISRYHYRWLVVTSEGIGYFNKNTLKQGRFQHYVSFSRDFDISLKRGRALVFKLNTLFFYLKFRNSFAVVDFVKSVIQAYLRGSANSLNPYSSFCRTSPGNDVKFYLNGGSPDDYYFADLHDAIDEAKKTVCITDWFFSPEIYLKRPIEDFPQSRLDLTLKRACERGVEVFIILYQGINNLTYHKTGRVKRYLMGLHPNFSVAHHPGRFTRHRRELLESSRKDGRGGLEVYLHGRYGSLFRAVGARGLSAARTSAAAPAS